VFFSLDLRVDRMEVISFDARHYADWKRIVDQSRNATFLHYREFMDYHAHRFLDASLMVIDSSGKPVAVLPACRDGDVVTSHAGLTYGALLMPPAFSQGDCIAAFEAIGTHFRSGGVRRLVYKPVPHIFHRFPAEEDLFALHRVGAVVKRRDLSCAIDLTAPLPYNKGRKWSVKRARECELILFSEVFDPAEFHALLVQVLMRHSVTPVHSVAEMALLIGRFPGRVRLFEARSRAELLAGALIFDFGRSVHTQYLAVSELGRGVFALDFLIDKLIKEVFSDRQIFSFGISTSTADSILNEGLHRQKEGFGARSVIHDIYEWVL
jgi:hypothetical protein